MKKIQNKLSQILMRNQQRTLNGRATSYFSGHNHSYMSILDGFSFPEQYLKECDNLGIEGFAITEHGNTFSWVYFDEIKSNFNTKMIYGVELYETEDITIKDVNNKYYHLVAFAKNDKGRIALNKLVTKSNFDGFYFKGRVDLNMMMEYADDLVVSSACLASKLSREKDYSKCIEHIKEYKKIFPNFYLEMQSHRSKDQVEYNKKILKLSLDTDTPYIITTDSHVAKERELQYQKYHVQIAKDPDTIEELYEGCYVQSVDEIYDIMIPQIGEDAVTLGLLNSLELLDLIEQVNMPFQEPKMPPFKVPEDYTENTYMLKIINDGWLERKIEEKYPDKIEEYKQRLEYEMSIISEMNYEGYFLITWDFLEFARKENIEIGKGRGSAGGSLISYLMKITDIDPIKYGLIFERFLNPERIGLPDIDSDFAEREKVIKYLEDKYGKENVCQVSNFSYITPKVAIKDIGNVLGIPYKVCDEVSKYFMGDNFEEEFERNKSIFEKYIKKGDTYKKWFEIASHISGKIRQTSVNACAVGIVSDGITTYSAMHKGEKGEQVIQVDKKMLERIGIVKMDLLGVKTLKVVQDTLNLIHKDSSYLDIQSDEFLSNKKTYDLLASGNTEGVFQVESYGMQDLCKRIKPQSIDEISAILALYRPDTMNLLEQYISFKRNPNLITYRHEDMKPIFEKEYGCMIYQEQMLDVVRKFGGRTYGGADLFRKAIGKKDKDLVKKEAQKLYNEIVKTGYDKSLAKDISEEMSDKGGYAFNKSHSVGYSMLTYMTAYLKSNHPTEFMTALLNSKIGKFAEISKYIVNCNSMNIKVLPPNINRSEAYFSPSDTGILFGLRMIKGIGESAFEKIMLHRKDGKFKGYEDFLNRAVVNAENKLKKNEVIALIKSGAIGNKKISLMKQYCDAIFEKRTFKSLKTTSGYTLAKLKEEYDIDTKDKVERLELFNVEKEKEFNKRERERLLSHRKEFAEKYMINVDKWEFEALSMYITYNPFEKALEIVSDYDKMEDGNNVTICGVVVDIDKKKDKNGGQYAFMNFYNGQKTVELIFWSNLYRKYIDKIKKGTEIVVEGKKDGEAVTVFRAKPYSKWKKEKGI